MATIEKRINDLERAIQPAGRVWAAWPTDDPELYELLQTDEILTLEAIRARLGPADTLLIVEYTSFDELADIYADNEHYD